MRLDRLVVFCGLYGLAGLPLLPGQAQAPQQPSPQTVVTPKPTRPGENKLPGLNPQSFFGDPLATPEADLDYQADTVETKAPDDSQFTLLGHVEVQYRGYVLNSDRADVNLDTGDTIFSGNVVMHSPNGQTVAGGKDGTLHLNLRHGTYEILGARSTVAPEALNAGAQGGIGIIQPIYVYGGVINGQRGLIDARGSSFTTCDFTEPHYFFKAKQVYIIPGRRLVAKSVTLYHKDRRILTIPYFFVPLDQRNVRQTLFPQVGQTPDEGYFIKFALGYALASSLPGIIHLDAMQYKGIGTGFEQNYGSPNALKKGTGLFSLYRLSDQQTGLTNLTGNLTHKQQFGTVGMSLTTQFQENSYLQGDSASHALNTQLNFTRAVGNLNTTLNTTLTTSDYGDGTSQNLTSSLSQTFQPTSKEQLVTKFDYSQVSSPSFTGATGASERRELDTNLDYTQKGKVYDLEILGVDFAQIGHSTTGASYFSGVERLPEIRFATDGIRNDFLRQFLPSTTHLTVSLGDFIEQFSKADTQRADINLDLGTTTKKIDSRDTFTYGGSFQQAFYGDDTAQYVLNGQTGYRLRIGGKSSLGVTYTYLKPYGFTPFQFDQTGDSNLASLSFNYQETKQLQVTVGTGYDFNREHSFGGLSATPWQNVAMQTIWSPTDTFRFRTTASYDLNSNRLLDLTNSARVRAPGGVSLDLTSQYAPQEHEFSAINSNIDVPFLRDKREDAGYRLRAIEGYNGFTKRFEYKGLALTRSWHDYEMTLVYQDDPMGIRPGSSFTFNFRLKAFPDYQPFSVGQFGQALDPSLGEVY